MFQAGASPYSEIKEGCKIMVDSKNENQEDFVISKDASDEEIEELDREDYYGNHTGVFRKKSAIPFVIGGIGLIILVILIILIIFKPTDVTGRGELKSLEARIQQLEGKLATIAVIDQVLDRLSKQEQQFKLLSKRIDRSEATFKTQIDQIIKELGILHQKKAQTATPQVQAPQPAAKPKKEINARLHLVRTGETLFSISQRYGITVEQLRSYNNIGPNAAIKPGQKLKLSRNGKP